MDAAGRRLRFRRNDGGGYGTDCMRVLIEIARFLEKLGYENDTETTGHIPVAANGQPLVPP